MFGEALVTMSSGLNECYILAALSEENLKTDIFDIIKRATEMGSYLGCAVGNLGDVSGKLLVQFLNTYLTVLLLIIFV